MRASHAVRVWRPVQGMRYLKLAIVLLVWSALSGPALAQQPSGNGGRTALWTSGGAGAGFGLGLFAGLTAFDDAINSDRKVWTSAIVGAAAGGTLGYLITRARATPVAVATGHQSRPAAAADGRDSATQRPRRRRAGGINPPSALTCSSATCHWSDPLSAINSSADYADSADAFLVSCDVGRRRLRNSGRQHDPRRSRGSEARRAVRMKPIRF